MKISPDNDLKYKKKLKTSGHITVQTTIYNILKMWFIKLCIIIVYNILNYIIIKVYLNHNIVILLINILM